jgi:hypothetical protein
MSHWFTLKTKLNSESAIKAGARRLGYMVVHNRMCRGYNGNETLCDLVMKLPGQYDIGFQKQMDGSYEVVADFWSDYISKYLANPEILERAQKLYEKFKIGTQEEWEEIQSAVNEAKISKFLQAYNLAAVEELIQRQGLHYVASTLPDGSVVYETISPSDATDHRVKTTVDPAGNLKVEAEGFAGSSCTEATAFLKSLGIVEHNEYKPEYYAEEELLKEREF